MSLSLLCPIYDGSKFCDGYGHLKTTPKVCKLDLCISSYNAQFYLLRHMNFRIHGVIFQNRRDFICQTFSASQFLDGAHSIGPYLYIKMIGTRKLTIICCESKDMTADFLQKKKIRGGNRHDSYGG